MDPRTDSTNTALIEEFLHLSTEDDVSSFLALSSKQIGFYLNPENADKHYVEYEIQKRSGGSRTIVAPVDALKLIQLKILHALELVYHPNARASAFVKQRGVMYNARPHLKAHEMVNFDIKDFFPSISENRIYGIFHEYFRLGQEASNCLKHLVCYHGTLPQGAPTSPFLSNMIMYRVDQQLSQIAKSAGCRYSRYVDDITISSNRRIPERIWKDNQLSEAIVHVIETNGFHLNTSKTRISRRGQRKSVTGIVVNEKYNVNRHYLRTVRAMLHLFSTEVDYGKPENRKEYAVLATKFHKPGIKPEDDLSDPEQVLKGMIAYIYQIRGENPSERFDNSLSSRLMQAYNRIQWPNRSQFSPKNAYPETFRLMNNVFSVHVTFDNDEVGVLGTAFLCDGVVYTCFHTFVQHVPLVMNKYLPNEQLTEAENENCRLKYEADFAKDKKQRYYDELQHPAESINRIEITEFNVENRKKFHTYHVEMIWYCAALDFAILEVPGLSTKTGGLSLAHHGAEADNPVKVLGYPEVNDFGHTFVMHNVDEKIESLFEPPFEDSIPFSESTGQLMQSKRLLVLSNQNTGILSGGSGGPVILNYKGATPRVIGIAIRGSASSDDQNQAIDLVRLLAAKPKLKSWA